MGHPVTAEGVANIEISAACHTDDEAQEDDFWMRFLSSQSMKPTMKMALPA